MEGRPASRRRSPPPAKGARWAIGFAVALVLVCLGGPFFGAWVVRAELLPRISARLGRKVTAGGVWVRLGRVELRDLVVDGAGQRPPIRVPRVAAWFEVAPLLAGRIEVPQVLIEHARVEAVRGGPEDNLSSLLEHLRGKQEGARSGASASRLHLGEVRIVDAAVGLAAEGVGEAVVTRVDAELRPDGPGQARLTGATLDLSAGPRVGADRVTVDFTLAHGRPVGLPLVTIEGGAATPVRGLDLTGIHGTIHPDAADEGRADLELHGSYGGSHRELWNAVGWLAPALKQGEIKVRAARFRLSQLDSVLKNGAQILDAHDGEADGRFDLVYRGDRVTWSGAFHLAGLTVAHPMLAPVPVPNLGFDARAHGTLDLAAHHLTIAEAAVDFRKVHAVLTADVDNVGARPKLTARLTVRPLPCQAALDAIPKELTPYLQGFKLAGTFSTDVHVGIDFGHLDQPIDLGGKVGIEGCTALEAPPLVDAERLLATFEQTVQVEPGKWNGFFVGPVNPNWVPYADISPNVVNSIMTTEDNGFFRHHGFISSEFRSALQQNLQRGYFRLGASSITMQMVKNVLLSREKTLSRKLQEMFLTWYLEHHLTKERILEIYFNVIEFGPGIYGIGAAAHHYFGKSAKELLPQEAAWFSSILPSPKRRYLHYCNAHPLLDAKWQAYVDRIMKRSHERGRLTDEQYQLALDTPVKFDRANGPSDRDCVALVKRLTTPQPIAPSR